MESYLGEKPCERQLCLKGEVLYYRLPLLSALLWGLANGCSHRPDTRVDYNLCSNHCS